jgi:hypothetical protein
MLEQGVGTSFNQRQGNGVSLDLHSEIRRNSNKSARYVFITPENLNFEVSMLSYFCFE